MFICQKIRRLSELSGSNVNSIRWWRESRSEGGKGWEPKWAKWCTHIRFVNRSEDVGRNKKARGKYLFQRWYRQNGYDTNAKTGKLNEIWWGNVVEAFEEVRHYHVMTYPQKRRCWIQWREETSWELDYGIFGNWKECCWNISVLGMCRNNTNTSPR